MWDTVKLLVTMHYKASQKQIFRRKHQNKKVVNPRQVCDTEWPIHDSLESQKEKTMKIMMKSGRDVDTLRTTAQSLANRKVLSNICPGKLFASQFSHLQCQLPTLSMWMVVKIRLDSTNIC